MVDQHKAIIARLGDLRRHIVDMGGKRDPGMKLVLTAAKAGQFRDEHAVSGARQVGGQMLEHLTPAPGALDENLVGHAAIPCFAL